MIWVSGPVTMALAVSRAATASRCRTARAKPFIPRSRLRRGASSAQTTTAAPAARCHQHHEDRSRSTGRRERADAVVAGRRRSRTLSSITASSGGVSHHRISRLVDRSREGGSARRRSAPARRSVCGRADPQRLGHAVSAGSQLGGPSPVNSAIRDARVVQDRLGRLGGVDWDTHAACRQDCRQWRSRCPGRWGPRPRPGRRRVPRPQPAHRTPIAPGHQLPIGPASGRADHRDVVGCATRACVKNPWWSGSAATASHGLCSRATYGVHNDLLTISKACPN